LELHKKDAKSNMFRFVMTDKISQSEKLLENAIQGKPLQ